MNRVGGANGHAGTAVDATLWVNVELSHRFEFWFILLGMNTVGRAYIHSEEIFDAGVGNYISHDEIPL